MSTVNAEADAPASTLRTILADRAVTAVIALAFLIMMGLGLVLPVLPLYARSFGVSFAGAATMLSAYGVARLALDVFAGALVDNIGERRAGTYGLLIVASATLATALAPTYILAVAVWGVAGAGSSVLMAANYSYILKVAPRDAVGRTMGVFYGSFNAGLLAGGFAGGLLAEHWGLASPLFVYAALSFAAAVLYRSLLTDPRGAPRPDRAPGARRSLERLRALLARRDFLVVLSLNFAYIWFVTAGFDTFVPLFGESQLGMSPAGIGAVYAALIITEFAVLYPAGLVADRAGRKTLLLTSFAALAVTVASLGSVASPLALGFVMAIMGVASGFAAVVPTSILSDVTADDSSGTAVGAFRFAGDLAFVVGPVSIGFALDNVSFAIAALVGAAPLVLAVLLALPLPETMRR